MGKINILQSAYTGKVGVTYGVKQHRKNFVKAVPFSHAPHNNKQTKAVRAFSNLNRLSAVIAKRFWQYLNLSDRSMYRSNAVAQWLKPCIKNGAFEMENIAEVIKQDGSLHLIGVEYSLEEKTFTVELRNNVESASVEDEKIFIAFVTSNGAVKWSTIATGENIRVSGNFDFVDFSSWYILAFKSIPWNGKRKIKGFTLYANLDVIVINGIWYLTRQSFESAPYVIDGVLYLNPINASVDNGILKIMEI